MIHTGFWEQQIEQFFKDDVTSCLNVAKIKIGIENCEASKFPGGLFFTSTLVIFCILEMLSAYFKGVLPANKPASKDDVGDFMVKYFSKYNIFFKDKNNSIAFYKVFRHGLVHQWSPKGAGAGMNSGLIDYSKIQNIIWLASPNDVPILNVPIFYELFLKAISDYRKDLDSNINNSRNLFERRYSAILKQDQAEVLNLKSFLVPCGIKGT